MDSIDVKILECLNENARQKASEISKKVNLSVSAVIERIHKLEEDGTIEQYTVKINQTKLGNDTCAFVEVSLEHPKYYEDFTRKMLGCKEIISCSYITGDFDFLVKVLAASSQELERVHRAVKSISGVSSTKTYFVLSQIKDEVSAMPKILERLP